MDTTVALGAVARAAQGRSVLLTVALLAALTLVVAALVPRRRVLTVAAGCSLAVVLGVTLTPWGGWGALGFEPGAFGSVLTNLEPHRSALTAWFRHPDGPANVALFVPAGLFVGLLTRRPAATVLGLTALSVAVEAWQATLTTRVGSFDDVVANGLGALAGAVVAAVVLALTRAGGAARGSRTGRAVRGRPGQPARLSRVAGTTVARNVRR